MSKKEKLIELDELLLDIQIAFLKDKQRIQDMSPSDLAVFSNYLRNNSVVAEKERSTVEKDTKARLRRASIRRAKNEST